MKKLFILLVVLSVALVSNAQVKVNKTFSSVVMVNSDTDYFTYTPAISTNNTLAFGLTVTGTGSPTVSVTLQEAVESGKWLDVSGPDTLITAGDVATKSHVYKLTDTPSFFYRVKMVQSGTGTTTTTSKLVCKGKN